MKNHFVSVIRVDATQGPLYGPFDDQEAEKALIHILENGIGGVEQTQIGAEELAFIHSDGYFESDDGGGVFIVQAEENPKVEDE